MYRSVTDFDPLSTRHEWEVDHGQRKDERQMPANLEEHAAKLLDWLYASYNSATPSSDIDSYLEENGLDIRFGLDVVRHLADTGLVEDVSTFGGPGALLNHRGIAAAQRRQAELAAPRRRAEELRRRMLTWLDQEEEADRIPVDWSEFEAGANLEATGGSYSHRDVLKAAQYLHHQGLITSARLDQASDGEVRPHLTAEGHACLTDFGGVVADYLARGSRGTTNVNTTSTTINVADNHGNMAMANKNVVQNLNMGLDVTEVLNLAGLVGQISQTLGLSDATRAELETEAASLHKEAESQSPNRGVMRRMIDGIVRLLGEAPTTAAKTMLVGLAEAAVQSITGS